MKIKELASDFHQRHVERNRPGLARHHVADGERFQSLADPVSNIAERFHRRFVKAGIVEVEIGCPFGDFAFGADLTHHVGPGNDSDQTPFINHQKSADPFRNELLFELRQRHRRRDAVQADPHHVRGGPNSRCSVHQRAVFRRSGRTEKLSGNESRQVTAAMNRS